VCSRQSGDTATAQAIDAALARARRIAMPAPAGCRRQRFDTRTATHSTATAPTPTAASEPIAEAAAPRPPVQQAAEPEGWAEIVSDRRPRQRWR
jgi:hypothetical protein